MLVTWDGAKRALNLSKHGVDLAWAADFEFETALVDEDRDVTGEQRFRAIGFIGDRLFFLAYTEMEEGIRAISLRFATSKERRRYAEGD